MALIIISRAEWGARAPKSVTRVSWSDRIGMAFHYSAGSPASTPRDLQDYAMNNLGYSDTHYNFFVDRQGRAFEGRGWLVVGGHAKDQNRPWIGVCFIGRDGDVTNAALNTMRDLWDEGNRLKGSKLRYAGHGQLPGQSTSCPGGRILNWIAMGIPRIGVQERRPPNVFLLKHKKSDAVYISDGMNTRHIPAGHWDLTCVPLINAGVPFLQNYADEAQLLAAGGPLKSAAAPLPGELPGEVRLSIPASEVTARLSVP